MNCEEARLKMDAHLSGKLSGEFLRELETHLAQCAECAQELQWRHQEEELLGQAMAELRPSASVRMRLAEACAQVRRKAESMIDLLPERWWLWVRWTYAALMVTGHTVFFLSVRSGMGLPQIGSEIPETRALVYWANLFGAFLSLVFLLGGRLIAEFNAFIGGGFAGRRPEPRRMEILIIHLMGAIGLLTTFLAHWSLALGNSGVFSR
jgi:hypothetical protein